MRKYLDLFRTGNVLMVFFAGALTFNFASYGEFDLSLFLRLLIACLSSSLILMAGNVHNNLMDKDRDTPSKNNPLTSGNIGKDKANRLWKLFFVSGVILAIFIGFKSFLIALLVSLMLYFYNLKLKDTLLAGNLVVALSGGLLFIFFGFAAGMTIQIIWAGILAFFNHLFREYLKDIEDIEQDKASGSQTVAIAIGEKKAIKSLWFLFPLVYLIGWYPAFTGVFAKDYSYIYITLSLLLLLISFSFGVKGKVRNAQLSYKLFMLSGMLAMCLGT